MRYALARNVIDSNSFTPISEDDYHTLVGSMNNLHLIVFIEESFDLLIGNYVEFEADLLAMAARGMVSVSPDSTRERNFIVNRRFTNLLNACRGYLDHTKHNLNILRSHNASITPRYLQEFKAYTSEEYDTFLGYRVMEEMRNHTQHVGFPIAVTYDRGWVGEGDDRKERFGIRPYLVIGWLGNKFKRKVREELDTLGEKADMMPLVRQYVGSLGKVHEKLRKLLRSDVEQWEKTVFGAIHRFENDHPGETKIGLMAVKIVGDRPGESTAIFGQPVEYRRTLERRSRPLGGLARRYVSSESR